MTENTPTTAVPPRQKIIDLVNSRYLSKAICIAERRGIADIVTAKEAVNISEVAAKLECNETNLYRTMSYLAANGVFIEKDGRNFIGNELSEEMRECTTGNVCRLITCLGAHSIWQSIANMELALDKDCEMTPFEIANGLPFYEYIAQFPEFQRNFDLGVSQSTSVWQSHIPDMYDFSKYSSVCDLAGGRGGLLKAIMLKNENIYGTLFESPAVVTQILPELTEDIKFKQRFRAFPGNFLESIDVVADIFTIAMTMHCFEDSRALVILKNIVTAMKNKAGSKLLIIEMDYDKAIIPNEVSSGRNHDILMMLTMGGRERKIDEWGKLLNANGLKILQKVTLPLYFMALECELS